LDCPDFRNFHQAKRLWHLFQVFHAKKARKAKLPSLDESEVKWARVKNGKNTFHLHPSFPRRSKLLKSAQNCFSLLLFERSKWKLSVHNAAQNFPSFCLSILPFCLHTAEGSL
jgi:hypothetical protein